jgi:1,4-dihydroxy-2-naphthoyl-CoA hydrolase
MSLMTDASLSIDESATSFVHSAMPLCATLGIVALEMSPSKVVLALEWAEGLCTTAGLLHGGAVMALADAAGGACAYANLPDGATGTSTIESKTNFLGGVKAGALVATSTPLHVGGSTIVIETELRNNGRLVGKTTQTQTVLRPR